MFLDLFGKQGLLLHSPGPLPLPSHPAMNDPFFASIQSHMRPNVPPLHLTYPEQIASNDNRAKLKQNSEDQANRGLRDYVIPIGLALVGGLALLSLNKN